MQSQWDHRNANRHGRTKKERHVIWHSWLIDQVDVQCAQGPSMLTVDCEIIAELILQKAK